VISANRIAGPPPGSSLVPAALLGPRLRWSHSCTRRNKPWSSTQRPCGRSVKTTCWRYRFAFCHFTTGRRRGRVGGDTWIGCSFLYPGKRARYGIPHLPEATDARLPAGKLRKRFRYCELTGFDTAMEFTSVTVTPTRSAGLPVTPNGTERVNSLPVA
jgi:hypothetical protein